MEKIIREYKMAAPLVAEQQINLLTRNLYFSEISEFIVEKGTIWQPAHKLENFILVFCVKGSGIAVIDDEQIPVSEEQFILAAAGSIFKFYSVIDADSRLYSIHFSGKHAKLFEKECSVVRNVIPSVKNRVANRELLFDEIFNNLSAGFHNENLQYVNFCFGHLLATFIYAYKTSDDFAEEANPVIHRSIDFMNKNLGKSLTLGQISEEAGYSPTYFTTLFRKETGYSPLSYFSHLKILKATELLDYTNNKVKEISFYLGYADPYYFTKDFTKRMGLSPRQYRNRIGKK